ncbi:MAG: glutaredoxin 3 [Cellvibrionaceae bacterium]
MPEVTIYTTRYCPFCVRAKQLLDHKNVDYHEIPVDKDRGLREKMMKESGQRTVPQIWINKQHVGGCDELYGLERAGELDALLQA